MMFLVGWITDMSKGATVVAASDGNEAKLKIMKWLIGQGFDAPRIAQVDRIHNPNTHGVLASVSG